MICTSIAAHCHIIRTACKQIVKYPLLLTVKLLYNYKCTFVVYVEKEMGMLIKIRVRRVYWATQDIIFKLLVVKPFVFFLKICDIFFLIISYSFAPYECCYPCLFAIIFFRNFYNTMQKFKCV